MAKKTIGFEIGVIETRMSNLVITELKKGTLILSEIVELLTCRMKEKNSLKNGKVQDNRNSSKTGFLGISLFVRND